MNGPSPGEIFRVEATGTCTKCGERREGWIAFGNADADAPERGPSVIVDTGGFMVFAEGIVCDECLGSSS